ncbi:hypothetical protein AB3S75_022679 [Citrus x aurantiifolia]
MANPLKKPLAKLLLAAILVSLSYLLGSNTNYPNNYSIPERGRGSPPPLQCLQLNFSSSSHVRISPPLHFEPSHRLHFPQEPQQNLQFFKRCPQNFTNYMPCHDPSLENNLSEERFFYRERHCPKADEERVKCLVPKPAGYQRPFPWPKSKELAWFKNVPFKKLTVFKKSQNWVRLQGDDLLVFPGGGTSFPKGVNGYVDLIKRVVPLKSGKIRTALDVGCGVASFGAALMDYNILTMSFAPLDVHEAQVQFALERGLPAMVGLLSTYQLPYPSRSFDVAHCSRCLVPWTSYDGLYLMEIDRVLRPGGYWVLSGPPISWKTSYRGWERDAKDLQKEQISLENLATRLCWKKIAERGPIAVWRKPTNHLHCIQKLKALKSPTFCVKSDPDAVWYTKMEPCITPLPMVNEIKDVAGGALEKWPKRLNTAPPRIRSGFIEGITVKSFNEDNQLWKKRVSHYRIILESLFSVPFDAKHNTLGILYERGLIGTYIDWCEAFSTYPRTYDLIHADGVFSMYMDKCDIVYILLEMHRILRPEGAIIIRDHVDIIVKVKGIIDRMRLNCQLLHGDGGRFHPEKILLVHNSL